MESAVADIAVPARLALAYAPRATRPRATALLGLDARLAAIVRRRGEPIMAQMRLAWWRDTLGSAPDAWPRGDPLLDLLRSWRAPEDFVPLVEGWELLLVEKLDRDAIGGFAAGRMKAWRTFAAEFDCQHSAVDSAARAWALGDLAGNLSEPAERAMVVEAAAGEPFVPPRARALRPLAILGGLGRRALARGGRPLLDGRGAALAALRLGMFGR